MAYTVKEVFLTLQGEGVHSGRRAVFVRFTGCNLWSGHERHRAQAICRFCDTDFVGTDGPGGGTFERADALVEQIPERLGGLRSGALRRVHRRRAALAALDEALIECAHDHGVEVAVETNGTLQAPKGVDWLCVSPKAGAELVQVSGDELKLVWPQELSPEPFLELEFKHWLLQPKDGQPMQTHLEQTIRYCLEHPPWKLSLQQHKICGLP